MRDVGTDDLARREREEQQQREAEERARADGREADDESACGADEHREHAVARLEEERGVTRALPVDERLDEEADAAEDQRRADDVLEQRVGGVPERLRQLYADQRKRR